jgi:hypothetical protein
MAFRGVGPRAADAKRALNRLRWELDYATDQAAAAGKPVDVPLLDIAEAVGIVTAILAKLGEVLPADGLDVGLGADRDRFVALVQSYTDYHKVAR